MYKRCLPLVLALAWVPNAYAAMPPCPKQPVRVDPLQRANSTPSSTTPFWYVSYYELLGNPLVVGALASRSDSDLTPESPTINKAGKCEVRVPVPLENVSSGSVSLNPVYPEGAGFGIIALPDMRDTTPDLKLTYRLGFRVDNQPLINTGEWVDIAQLELRWNQSTNPKDANATVYRLRKAQREKNGLVLELIEARTPWAAIGTRPPEFERVVATVVPSEGEGWTPIALRWTQRTGTAANNNPAGYPVDAFVELLGPEDKVLYSIVLPDQWASALSMGLLDYNVMDKATAYAGRYAAEMEDTSLEATECAGALAVACPIPDESANR